MITSPRATRIRVGVAHELTLKYSTFSLCLCSASDNIRNVRRVTSKSSVPADSPRVVSWEKVGWIVESTLMSMRKPSISRKTSFVHASWYMILWISVRTYASAA